MFDGTLAGGTERCQTQAPTEVVIKAELVEKECKDCKEIFPINEFSLCQNKKGNSWRSSYCKKCSTHRVTAWEKKNPNRVWRNKKSHASQCRLFIKKWYCKSKGIEFNLSAEWFEKNYARGCAVTGIVFRNESNGKPKRGPQGPYSCSIDRIDPNQGYLESNCRLILFGVNGLKGTGTDEDMQEIAKAIFFATTKSDVNKKGEQLC